MQYNITHWQLVRHNVTDDLILSVFFTALSNDSYNIAPFFVFPLTLAEFMPNSVAVVLVALLLVVLALLLLFQLSMYLDLM